MKAQIESYIVGIQFTKGFKAERFVTVLGIPPVESAETAGRVQIVKDAKQMKAI